MPTSPDFKGRQLPAAQIDRQLVEEARGQVKRLILTPKPAMAIRTASARTVREELENQQGLHTRKKHRTAEKLLDQLWGNGTPYDEWWTTPLGDAVAGALPMDSHWRWSSATAAHYLGIGVGSIFTMVSRRTITSEPVPGERSGPGIIPSTVVAYKIGRDERRRAAAAGK